MNLTQPDEACRDGRQRRQARTAAALALARGLKVSDAAVEAGVSERTIYRWNRLPKFARHVARLRGEMVRRAAGKLADAMAEAADELRALMTDDEPAVRHRAAAEIIKSGVRLAELAELEERVAEVERRLGDPNGPARPAHARETVAGTRVEAEDYATFQ